MEAAACAEVWGVRAGVKPQVLSRVPARCVASAGRAMGRGAGSWRSAACIANKQPAHLNTNQHQAHEARFGRGWSEGAAGAGGLHADWGGRGCGMVVAGPGGLQRVVCGATSRQAGRWALPPAQGRLVRTGQAGSQRHLCGEFGLCLPALAPGSASIGCKSVIKSRKPPQSPDPGGVGVSPFPWHHQAPSRCETVHGHPSTHGCSPEPCARCRGGCQNFCLSSPADKALEKGGFFKI